MAKSICEQCEESTFELVIQTPAGSTFPINFVQCASCGNIVGVVEQYNAAEVGFKLETMLKKIAAKLEVDL